jgi:hypothetical protein
MSLTLRHSVLLLASGGIAPTVLTDRPSAAQAGTPVETLDIGVAPFDRTLTDRPTAAHAGAPPTGLNVEALFSSDFDGATLPDPWTFEEPTVDASFTVSGSRVHVTVPGGTAIDSISSTTSPDNSVGLVAPLPAHGGDVDVAVQVDTDVLDMLGQGINLICKGSGSDAARFVWFHDNDTDRESGRMYGYGRAGGVGDTLGGAVSGIGAYMTGQPAWLRIRYTAATGLWEALDSADGVTWRVARSGTRSFTPTTFKVSFTSTAPTPTGNTVRINKIVDVIGAGTTDLRDTAGSWSPTSTTVIDPTVQSALPAGWVNDSAGTSSVSFVSSVLRFTHDCTQDATGGGAGCRIRYTGAYHAHWGIHLVVACPDDNSSAFLTLGAAKAGNGTWIDQYTYDGGYGLEIQLGAIRRPIRIDDPTGATVTPVAPYPTDLNEMPYCWLADLAGQYDMGLGGVRHFRLERQGRRYRVREWADGAAEPSTWALFDGQDQTEDDALAPTLTLSHNGVRTGTAGVDVHELEFYSLAASGSVTLLDRPSGVQLGGGAERAVADVVVADRPAAAPAGGQADRLLVSAVLADRPTGASAGTPGEALHVGVLVVDRSSGAQAGGPGEQITATTPVTLTDRAGAAAAGEPGERLIVEWILADRAGAAQAGTPGDRVVAAVVLADRASAAAAGGPRDALDVEGPPSTVLLDRPSAASAAGRGELLAVEVIRLDRPAAAWASGGRDLAVPTGPDDVILGPLRAGAPAPDSGLRAGTPA